MFPDAAEKVMILVGMAAMLGLLWSLVDEEAKD